MPAFSDIQRTFILNQAEMTYSALLGEDLTPLLVGSCMILDDCKYGKLPEEWTPEPEQREAIYEYCLSFHQFWHDLQRDPDTTSEDILLYGDVREVVIATQRNLMHLV